MREKQFRNGNLSFSYTMSETDGPPLVLLHGLTFGRRAYLSLIEALPRDLKVFAPDFRGHGQSARMTPPYLFADLVDDTNAFLHQCVRQPAYFFGHSLGGGVGLAVSASAPESVRGLIVSDNSLTRESHLNLVVRPSIRRLFEGLRKIALPKPGPKEAAEALANLLLPVPGVPNEIRLGDFPGNSPGFLKMWAECLTACDPEIVSLLFNQENIAAFNPEQYLRKLRCPLLLLQANPDLGGLLSDADVAIGKNIKPDLEILRFPDANHFMHLHDAEATVKAITDFIAKHEGHCG